jgi:hypothetical protein
MNHTLASSRTPQMRLRNLLLAINLLLGLSLWLSFCTDYGWANVWANLLFPPLVGIFGLVCLLARRTNTPSSPRRWRLICCLPSVLGGLPYLVLLIFALLPPFLLATLFWLDEQSNATRIQQVSSPDGTKIAEVYFLPVGAYSGGNGRIEIHLKYRWIPFLKRDIYYLPTSDADTDTHDYIVWRDNSTITVSETHDQIQIEAVRWRVPPIISVPWRAARMLARVTS